MATSHGLREAIWLWQLVLDVGFKQEGVALIMCNNQGSIALAKNLMHHARTKHIDAEHHFIKEKVERAIINLGYFWIEHVVADMVTKALQKDWHDKFARMMELANFGHLQSRVVEG